MAFAAMPLAAVVPVVAMALVMPLAMAFAVASLKISLHGSLLLVIELAFFVGIELFHEALVHVTLVAAMGTLAALGSAAGLLGLGGGFLREYRKSDKGEGYEYVFHIDLMWLFGGKRRRNRVCSSVFACLLHPGNRCELHMNAIFFACLLCQQRNDSD